MDTTQNRNASRLAAIAAILMLLTLAMSATIRLAHEHCNVSALPLAAVMAARILHRICAMAVGVILIALALFSWRLRPLSPGRALRIAALFLLTVFLAVLGRASAGSSIPAVPVFNVMAGMFMLSLFWMLHLEFSVQRRLPYSAARPGILIYPAAALSVLQIALGAWVGGLAAASGCTPAPVAAAARWWPDATTWQALALFHEPVATPAALAQASATLTLWHQALTVALLVLVVPLCAGLMRSGSGGRKTSLALLVSLSLLATAGILSTDPGASAWLGVVHNNLAALFFALLCGLLYRRNAV